MGFLKNAWSFLTATIFPSRAVVYMVLIASALSFGGGLWVSHKFHQAAEYTAVQEARGKEQSQALATDQIDKHYLAQLNADKEKNDATIKDLQARLAAAPHYQLPVPADWLQKPSGMSGVAAFAVGLIPAGAAVDQPAAPTADSADVVATCERNKLEVSDPNAQQLTDLQAWYTDLAKRYNR